MRPNLLLLGLAWSGFFLHALAAGNDFANPPLYLVSEKVELLVGPDLTLVSGHYRFQYAEKEDPEHAPLLYIHFPLYVEKGLTDWHEIAGAAGFQLQIGNLPPFKPVAGSIVPADFLSSYPVPEDAAVAFLSFEVPADLARRGFEVMLNYTQPNIHYHGSLLSVYTAWLPKFIEYHAIYALTDHDFELRVTAARGVTLRRFPTEGRFVQESPTELLAIPEHRKTIAVEILPDHPH